MADADDPVDDAEALLRTSFAPDHVVDGKIIAAALPSRDLSERGYSIDREALADFETIRERAASQMERDPNGRNEAWISRFNCGAVRSMHCVDDKLPGVRVQNEPLKEEADRNLAHGGIYSATKRSPSKIKALKDALLPYINEDVRPLSDFLTDRNHQA